MLKSRRFWLGAVVSAGFLALLFWQVNLRETATALKQAEYWWLVPAIGAYFIAVMFRAIRWHFLLLPLKSIPGRRLYPIVVIGYMANNLLPAKLGELVRAFFVGQKEGVGKSAALATIALERVFDGVFLLVLALLIWPFLPVSDLLGDFTDDIWKTLLVVAIPTFFVMALGLFFSMAFFPQLGMRIVGAVVQLAPGRFKNVAAESIGGFMEGLASLRNPRRVMAIMLFTIPIWMAEGSMYFLIAQGFDLGQPFHGILLVLSTSNLATVVPTAGGIGPFEYATTLTLVWMDVGRELAAAYAIVLHVALLAPVTLLGLYFLWTSNVSLGEAIRQPDAGHKSEGFEHAHVGEADR